MKWFTYLAISPLLLITAISCSKKENTPSATISQVDYTVAFSVYSLQPKFLFIYTDINGTHTDTISTQNDSITTVVPSGSDMQFLQRVQCLDTTLQDALSIRAYMNGRSISNSKTKPGTGPLIVGVELQSLL